MGRLTDDMTRLSHEIASLHRARDRFMDDLKEAVFTLRDETSEMRAGFRNAHTRMADRTRANLSGFVSDLTATVAGLQTGFQDEHAQMAKRMKADHRTFLSGVREAVGGLKEKVAGMRREFAEDIAGGRHIWFGVPPIRFEMKQKTGSARKKSATKARKNKSKR